MLARSLLLFLVARTISADSADIQSFEDVQAFLKSYCQSCHVGKGAAGGFNVQKLSTRASLQDEAGKWLSLIHRVKNHEMPPRGTPAPALEVREQLTDWAEKNLRAEVCATGVTAGPSLIRRLNRDEFTATVRDLLDIHMDIGRVLPADGAGGEGFDNAAETLFLSPLHSEKYLEVSKFAFDFAAKEFKSRNKFLIAKPGPDKTQDQAAREILDHFLPNAFRRPVTQEDVAPYFALFQTARKQGRNFETSILFALRASLISPNFLFRIEPPNSTGEARLLDQYALASRLSYFLWGSMPDELLFDVAAAGKLQDPAVLKKLTRRMVRHDRSLQFVQRFTEQWLGTRQLGAEKTPDSKLFPTWAADEELRGDIRFEPILFLRELITRDMSLLNLLDSKFTVATSNLVKHYDVKFPIGRDASKQPQWVAIPDGSPRGGLLGMSAVLAVSSHPYRTSPVLRGAWILDAILGTPPPPPPPEVPALEEHKQGAAPKSVRERLEQHRANPACASCHSRIDGLGFALENYDAIGRWRNDEDGQPIDNSGELADGSRFKGHAELKKILLDRKDLFIRNLATKMLGYALGRGLTLKDFCAVDQIVAEVRENNYSAQSLIDAIVLSVPFRYQSPVAAPKELKKP